MRQRPSKLDQGTNKYDHSTRKYDQGIKKLNLKKLTKNHELIDYLLMVGVEITKVAMDC